MATENKKQVEPGEAFWSEVPDELPETEEMEDVKKAYAKLRSDLYSYVRQRQVLASKHKVFVVLLTQSLLQKSVFIRPSNYFLARETKLDVKTVRVALKWLAEKKIILLGKMQGKKNIGRSIVIMKREHWSNEIVE